MTSVAVASRALAMGEAERRGLQAARIRGAVIAILGALLDGKVANMTGVFAGSLELAVPITLGALAGILSERSGMLNIAIEGKFLVGACAGAVAASVTDSAVAGVVVAVLCGMAVGYMLAWLGIRHQVDHH